MKTKKLIIPFLTLFLLFVAPFESSVCAVGNSPMGEDGQMGEDGRMGQDITVNFDDPNKYSVYKDYPHLKKSFGEYYDDWENSGSELSFEDYLKQQRNNETLETAMSLADTADNVFLLCTLLPVPANGAMLAKGGTTVLKNVIKQIMKQTAAQMKNKSFKAGKTYYKAFTASGRKGVKNNLNGTVRAFAYTEKNRITKKIEKKIIIDITVKDMNSLTRHHIKTKTGKSLGWLTKEGKLVDKKGKAIGRIYPMGSSIEKGSFIVNKENKIICYMAEDGQIIDDLKLIKAQAKLLTGKKGKILGYLTSGDMLLTDSGEIVGKALRKANGKSIGWLTEKNRLLSDSFEELGKLHDGIIKNSKEKIIAYIDQNEAVLTPNWLTGNKAIKKRIKQEWKGMKEMYGKSLVGEEALLLGKKGEGKILAKNMEMFYGKTKPKYAPAHHIVPKAEDVNGFGNKLRDILKKYNIDINDPRNGVFLPADKFRAEVLNMPNHMDHNILHGPEIMQSLYTDLSKCNSRNQVFEVLNDYRQAMLKNDLFWLK